VPSSTPATIIFTRAHTPCTTCSGWRTVPLSCASSTPLTPVYCMGGAITAAMRWSSSPAPTIFTNYEDFFPMGRQIHLLRFMDLQPQQQHGGGGRWRCRTSSTAGSGARGEDLAAEGASE
jgi:hypothetical protein